MAIERFIIPRMYIVFRAWCEENSSCDMKNICTLISSLSCIPFRIDSTIWIKTFAPCAIASFWYRRNGQRMLTRSSNPSSSNWSEPRTDGPVLNFVVWQHRWSSKKMCPCVLCEETIPSRWFVCAFVGPGDERKETNRAEPPD